MTMTYLLNSHGLETLRSAAEEHGAGEAELAAIERFAQGTAEGVDVERLTSLAKLADLPWDELFQPFPYFWCARKQGTAEDETPPLPSFKCEVCGKPCGAHITLQGWAPSPCYWCRRKQLAREASQRRREQPRVLAGVEVDAAVDAFRELPVFADLPRRFRVDVGHSATGGCGGRAVLSKKRPKMRVYGGPETTPERVLEVVLHELCHLALPSGVHHGERFRRTFARAVREAWGLEVPVDVAREHHGNASYKMGEIVIGRLRGLIAEGKIETFPPEPPAPKPSRAEHLAEIVKLREEHAEKMLARAERRLKLAKTSHAKWRAKVSYYEKQAAKRGAK